MRNTPSLLPWAFVAAIVCLAHALLGQDPPSQEIKCFNESEAPPPGTGLGCNDLAHYIPTAATPVKTVRIAFHIMQRADPNPEDPIEVPKENFDETDPDHVAYLDALFNRLNSLYSFCNVMWCGCQTRNL